VWIGVTGEVVDGDSVARDLSLIESGVAGY
jgi:hypothetical protein